MIRKAFVLIFSVFCLLSINNKLLAMEFQFTTPYYEEIYEEYNIVGKISPRKFDHYCLGSLVIRNKKIQINANPLESVSDLNNLLSAFPECSKIDFSRKRFVWENIEWNLIKDSLEELCFETEPIAEDKLNFIFSKLNNLKTFEFLYCDEIDLNQINWSLLPNLEKIELINTFINSNAINKILESCPQLKTLIISTAKHRSGVNFEEIDFTIARNLKKINIAGRYISIGELNHILEQCKSLNSLNLNDCGFWINNKSYINLFNWNSINWERATELRKLSLSETKSIYPDEINNILKNIPQLEKLTMTLMPENFEWDEIIWSLGTNLTILILRGLDHNFIRSNILTQIPNCRIKVGHEKTISNKPDDNIPYHMTERGSKPFRTFGDVLESVYQT